jgi:hypothetical protein
MQVARWCTRILSRRHRIPADIRAEVDEAEIERLAWNLAGATHRRAAIPPGTKNRPSSLAGMAELKR